MSHTEQSVTTGHIDTIDLGEKVRISANGMFYGRGFTFEKTTLTGVDADVTLEAVVFYEDARSSFLRAIYAGEETDYLATIKLRDILDIDGDLSKQDFLTVKPATDRDRWNGTKAKRLWPMDDEN